MLLPLQGVTNERALTQGVASLALGYVLLPFQGVHSWLQNHAEKTWILNTLPNGVTHLITPLIIKNIPMTETDEGKKRAHPKGVRPNMIVS